MPHRSRLAVLLLDLPPETHDAGRDFWSAATGRPAPADPGEPEWSSLGDLVDGWHVSVQRSGEGTPARWHVDVETDDIAAETARLEGLGARRLADMGRVLADDRPGGACLLRRARAERGDRPARDDLAGVGDFGGLHADRSASSDAHWEPRRPTRPADR